MTDESRGRVPLVAAATFVATAVALRALSGAIPRPIVLLVSVPLLLWGFAAQQRLSAVGRAALLGCAGGLAAILALFSARVVWESVVQPPQWDFLGFWLNGRVAASRLNFYETAHATELAAPYNPSEEFRREILDVGFWYPPPSIFIFLPLGFADLATAAALWYTAMVVILGACVLILWRTFLPRSGLFGLLIATALTLGIFGTRSTFQFGQDNFLTLLALLLFWTRRDRMTGGIALALGMLVKPFLGGFLLYLALRRRWRTLAGVAVGLTGMCALTLAVFGWAPFQSYLSRADYAQLPPWVYTEPSNQSLLASILRVAPGLTRAGTPPMGQPAFLASAFALCCVTIWCVWRGQERDEWAAASTLLLALLIYPASQMFYCILLVVPFLILWTDRDRVPGGGAAVAVGIGVLYALMDYRGGRHVFVATLATWIVAVILGGVAPRRRPALDAGPGVR